MHWKYWKSCYYLFEYVFLILVWILTWTYRDQLCPARITENIKSAVFCFWSKFVLSVQLKLLMCLARATLALHLLLLLLPHCCDVEGKLVADAVGETLHCCPPCNSTQHQSMAQVGGGLGGIEAWSWPACECHGGRFIIWNKRNVEIIKPRKLHHSDIITLL